MELPELTERVEALFKDLPQRVSSSDLLTNDYEQRHETMRMYLPSGKGYITYRESHNGFYQLAAIVVEDKREG